ncbi:hypothetical protein FPE01S_04_03950 [Flavihumibacter petaseus NBRC 106054]|uniref:DUF2490 domain-containing protein n=2 Tax=Flavihumibacter TaxID=1004301 RepID=A0A0E9N5B0_9BACT|nr:hypothetical protein FPE01S_04_03950 [Flavihumibacter petaseus NBRC 106054]
MCCILVSCSITAQVNTYHQFWNEFAFTGTIGQKWSLELNLGDTYTSTPSNHSVFASSAQIYARVWGHYYMNAKWKFSIFFAGYYNKYVPDIDQREYPESRLALQATWYIKKGRYTLLSRMRMEDRHIKNTDGYNEGVYRFRDQIKLIYPINERRIRAKVAYGIGSMELLFKTPSQVTGDQFFDRSRLTIGGGYSVTDDVQLELTYVNEFLPRETNEVYHALQFNVAFNNLFRNIYKKLHKDKPPVKISSSGANQ